MVSTFTVATRAAVPATALFDVSLSIDDHISSMAQSGERAIGGVTAGTIGLGETVTWRAKHFGIWFTLTSKISSLERPLRFVDEQIRGPFRVFHHQHMYEESGSGNAVSTLMTDTITIASPIFGRLAESLILVPYLRRLIQKRNHHLLLSLGIEPTTAAAESAWLLDAWTPFRRYEATTVIGHGGAAWERAAREVLRWGVKTRSGFRVDDVREVTAGARPMITAQLGPIRVAEPVEVVSVVTDENRVGFAYRTLPGHPVRGEEAFVVHRSGDQVALTVRSLTAPAATRGWRLLYPALRVAQVIARRRYRRALISRTSALPTD